MLEAPPLPSLLYNMSVVCDKGKGRPLGDLNTTFSIALKVLQCSKTIMSYDQSQCILLALGGALSAVRAQCNYLGIWPY